jgi:hypothetical protein
MQSTFVAELIGAYVSATGVANQHQTAVTMIKHRRRSANGVRNSIAFCQAPVKWSARSSLYLVRTPKLRITHAPILEANGRRTL